MKKISIPKPRLGRVKKRPESSRITNETVAEHRERVIAEGKRFKYPLQYARHKLVINTLLISLAAIITLVLLGWWQLYPMQNTGTFFYRVTQLLRLPVGSVEGSSVRYSDYMLYYRPSEHFLRNYDEIDQDSQDGKLQLEYKKRDAMDRAIADAYARKIAREQNLSVSSEEVDEALTVLRQADNGTLSDDEVNSSAEQVLGLTRDDTRTQYRNSILRGKAAFAIDERATRLVTEVEKQLKAKKDLKSIAEALNKSEEGSVNYGTSGTISRSTVFNGVYVNQIADAKKGEIVGPFKSIATDGYLFARIIGSNDRQVNFEFLIIPLTAFFADIERFKADGSVDEYITIDPEQYTPNEEQ